MKTKIKILAKNVKIGQKFFLNNVQNVEVKRIAASDNFVISSEHIYYVVEGSNGYLTLERCPQDYEVYIDGYDLSQFKYLFIDHIYAQPTTNIHSRMDQPFVLEEIENVEIENWGTNNKPSWTVVIVIDENVIASDVIEGKSKATLIRDAIRKSCGLV
jgi:hypothetical protein